MRWPWRRRTSSGGRHALPRQRAAWAQPALPPTPEPSTPAPAPVSTPAPAPPVAEQRTYAVRLGFADGSEVGLAAGDPSALALRAVADLLVQVRPE